MALKRCPAPGHESLPLWVHCRTSPNCPPFTDDAIQSQRRFNTNPLANSASPLETAGEAYGTATPPIKKSRTQSSRNRKKRRVFSPEAGKERKEKDEKEILASSRLLPSLVLVVFPPTFFFLLPIEPRARTRSRRHRRHHIISSRAGAREGREEVGRGREK
jgi:hypothetical protein